MDPTVLLCIVVVATVAMGAYLLVVFVCCRRDLKRAAGGDNVESRSRAKVTEDKSTQTDAAADDEEEQKRFYEVSVALASCPEVEFRPDDPTEPAERRNIQLDQDARRKHVVEGQELTASSAKELCDREIDFWSPTKNTVFQQPEAWDHVLFPGYGHLIVSRNKVPTFQCHMSRNPSSREIYWYPRFIGRCYAVFVPNGHLCYLTSFATRKLDFSRPH